MRKMTGILGIAALLITGCGAQSQPDSDSSEAAQQPDVPETSSLLVFSVLNTAEEGALYMDEDSCYVSHPAVAGAMGGIEGSEVIIRDSSGDIAAVTEIETDHDEAQCTWFFNAEVDGTSEFYSADFLDMTTPTVSASDAKDGQLVLDIVSPIQEKAKESIGSPIDYFPGN